jgi:hypothetical protein
MTDAPESEEEETLLLKLVQSVVERQPKVAPEAVVQVKVPLVVLSPAPMLLNAVPLREMRFVESPWIVPVAETKRMEVEATPVVVEFPLERLVKEPVVPVTVPAEETFAALMFPPVMFPVLSAPPNVDVALPMTARFVVVAVPETMSWDDDAVPLVTSDPVLSAEVVAPRVAKILP